jgi:adenylylsulfate kinase
MIWWLYGESGSGKTTLAEKICEGAILLDADTVRPAICEDLGFSEDDRRKNNKRIARLAKVLDDQGFDVVVSTICPYEDLRKEVYWITKCRFVKVEGKHDA